jgi:hypothetical protein
MNDRLKCTVPLRFGKIMAIVRPYVDDIYEHILTHTHTYTHIRTHSHTYTSTHSPTHIHLYKPVHTHTHMHKHKHLHSHSRTKTYSYCPTHTAAMIIGVNPELSAFVRYFYSFSSTESDAGLLREPSASDTFGKHLLLAYSRQSEAEMSMSNSILSIDKNTSDSSDSMTTQEGVFDNVYPTFMILIFVSLLIRFTFQYFLWMIIMRRRHVLFKVSTSDTVEIVDDETRYQMNRVREVESWSVSTFMMAAVLLLILSISGSFFLPMEVIIVVLLGPFVVYMLMIMWDYQQQRHRNIPNPPGSLAPDTERVPSISMCTTMCGIMSNMCIGVNTVLPLLTLAIGITGISLLYKASGFDHAILENQLMFSLFANVCVALISLSLVDCIYMVYAISVAVYTESNDPSKQSEHVNAVNGLYATWQVCLAVRAHVFQSISVALLVEAAFFSENNVTIMRLVSSLLLFEVAHLDHFFHGAAPHSYVSGNEWMIGILQCFLGCMACVLVLLSVHTLQPSLLWEFVNPGGEWFMIPVYWLWARTIVSLYKAAVNFPHPMHIRYAYMSILSCTQFNENEPKVSTEILSNIAKLMSASMLGPVTDRARVIPVDLAVSKTPNQVSTTHTSPSAWQTTRSNANVNYTRQNVPNPYSKK